MQDVYANAVVNISTDTTIDSSVGLGSKERLVNGIEVGKLKGGKNVYARAVPEKGDCYRLSHMPHGLGWRNVLNNRAWVLQERMLSPRILHFSAFELALECDTHITCECKVQPRKSNMRDFRKAIAPNAFHPSGIARSWPDLISTYSCLNLTFESDKLVALAGLASRAAKCCSKTYIAGL